MRLSLLAVPMLLIGCAPISPSDRALVEAPPDCTAPEAQIAQLEAIRPSEFRRATTTVETVTPTGLVVGTARNDFEDRGKVISGEWGRKIDQAIIRIKATCKLP